jgi:DNA-binding XRE family transcriptional regulator
VIALPKLLELRKKCGLSQLQLAKAAGVSQQEICFIEIGKRCNPGIITMLKIAKVLQCSLYDLIDEQESA